MVKRMSEITKRCEVCNNSYKTTREYQKYCSRECRLEKQRREYISDGKKLKKESYLKLRFDILSRDNFTCQYCGRTPSDGAKLHVDHIVPKSKSGSESIDNLITSCEECNLGKGATLLDKYKISKIKSRIYWNCGWGLILIPL